MLRLFPESFGKMLHVARVSMSETLEMLRVGQAPLSHQHPLIVSLRLVWEQTQRCTKHSVGPS